MVCPLASPHIITSSPQFPHRPYQASWSSAYTGNAKAVKLESLESLSARLKAEAEAQVGEGGIGGGERNGRGGGAASGGGVQHRITTINGGVIIGRAGDAGVTDVLQGSSGGGGGAAETKIVHQFETVSSEQQLRLQQIASTKQQHDGIIGK